MNTITIDIKTRSCASIKTHGIFVYAQNKSTQVICVTVKKNSEPPVVWLPPELRRPEIVSISDDRLRQMLEEAELIQAYDITTEFALWKYTLCRLYPWFPEVPIKKLSCIAARAAYLGMGFPLCTLREKLGSSVNDAVSSQDGAGGIFTNSMKKISTEGLALLLRSCLSSVAEEADIAGKLIDLPPMEQKIWRAVLAMNDQGILIDRELVLNHLEQTTCEDEMLREEFHAITGIRNPMNGDAVMAYLIQHGIALKSLGQTDLVRTIRLLPQGLLRRIVEIRYKIGQNRPLFCKRLLSLLSADSRVRGIWEYYGNTAGNCRTRYLPDIEAVSGFAVPADKKLFRICRLPEIQNMLSIWTDCPESYPGLIEGSLKEYCKTAVLKPGITFHYGKLKISSFCHFLKIVLPSGRDLFLYEPEIDKKRRLLCQVRYNRTAQQMELSGGMICQMIENALKRDVAMYYLTGLWENGFTPVLFDVQEIVAEDPVSSVTDDFFNDFIADQPEWIKESFRQPVMCLCCQWRKQS